MLAARTARVNPEDVTAYQLTPTRWMVSSRSNPSEAHLVTTDPVSCDCRGYEYRRNCTHAIAVREALGASQPRELRSLTDLFN